MSCRMSYHMSYVISYHIISYHIMSYHIISYHVISYHIISHHIISDQIRSDQIRSDHIILYHITSYHIIPYQCHIIFYIIISHHIRSYHIISYHIISYHIISHYTIILSCYHIIILARMISYHTDYNTLWQWAKFLLTVLMNRIAYTFPLLILVAKSKEQKQKLSRTAKELGGSLGQVTPSRCQQKPQTAPP